MVTPRPSELALAVGILEGRFVAPQHLVQGPTYHASTDEEGEDLVHTQAVIPGSTVALGAPGLAREESVIARMVELRKPESARRISNFFAAVGSFVLEDVPSRIRLFRSPSRRVRRRVSHPLLSAASLRRLWNLDGPTKVLVLAAPYVMALAVAALLLERQQLEASTPIALEPAMPVVAPDPTPPEPLVAAEIEAPAVAEPELRLESLALAWDVRLSARPSRRAKRVGVVEAGTALELIQGLDTKTGWALARSPETGEVGYVRLSHLESEPPSKVKASRAEKKRRRSRR